ncbi:MAG: GyrI-like domain-containing protein, partial [Anaerolineales bacterium]|nr:GyrI-like domain-containing protein [Anaerolineales bacterium]
MSTLEVKIVKLEPLRAISAYGFGPEPEGIAFDKIKAFSLKHGLSEQGAPSGTFGFNNPNPSPGSPNYGYEIWLPVGPEVEPEGDLRVIQFDGGLYATTVFT